MISRPPELALLSSAHGGYIVGHHDYVGDVVSAYY